jgi:hypothetical protein
VSANGRKMVSKRHSDVYRIETTMKSDINVSITPPFLQGYVCIILKILLHSSGIKTESESVSEMAKGYPPGLRLLYSSGFERQPSRFDGMHALDR